MWFRVWLAMISGIVATSYPMGAIILFSQLWLWKGAALFGIALGILTSTYWGQVEGEWEKIGPASFDQSCALKGRFYRKYKATYERDPPRVHSVLGKKVYTQIARIDCEDGATGFLKEHAARFLTNSSKLTTALRKALVMGDGSEIPREYWNALNKWGLSHLLVISGSHFTWIVLMLTLLLKRGRRKNLFFVRGVIASVMLLFLCICKTDTAVIRAALGFFTLWILSPMLPFMFRYRSTDVLAIIGVALLLYQPWRLWQPAYGLSFGVTWALLTSESVLEKLFWPSIFAQLIGNTYGLLIHPLSVLTNIIFVPLLTLIIFPLSFMDLVADFHFDAVVRWLMDGFVRSAGLVSDFPSPHLIFSTTALILSLQIMEKRHA